MQLRLYATFLSYVLFQILVLLICTALDAKNSYKIFLFQAHFLIISLFIVMHFRKSPINFLKFPKLLNLKIYIFRIYTINFIAFILYNIIAFLLH